MKRSLVRVDVQGRRVLEVGARDVNGSVGPYLKSLDPGDYVGVDIEAGPGVNEICDAGQLVERFGADSFDIVVSTELVEHVRDWPQVFLSMKSVLRPGGTIVVTTRSPGFPYHGYPCDFWRYTAHDMRSIFADFERVHVEPDAAAAGAFVRGTKPESWLPAVVRLPLFSVVVGRPCERVSGVQVALFRLRSGVRAAVRRIVPEGMRAPIRRLVRR